MLGAARTPALLAPCSLCLFACLASPGEPTMLRPHDSLPAPPGPSGPTGPAPDPCAKTLDPGRATLHRLNRAEYDNTVRDLLSDTTHPAEDFPADDHGYGFDNNADVLSVSPLLFEKWQIAASNLATTAIGTPTFVPIDLTASGREAGGDMRTGSPYDADGWLLFTNGLVSTMVTLPGPGTYEISVRAFGQQAGPDPARMQIRLGGSVLGTADVTAVESAPVTYRATATATGGPHRIGAAFINDYYAPMDPDPTQRDRNLVVLWLEIKGPAEGAPVPHTPFRDTYLRCTPGSSKTWEACAREVLGPFARAAWRRPPAADELDRLVTLTTLARDNHDPFDTGVGLGLQAILLSPHFVFRVELDPTNGVHPLSDHELAARLSYFLWSSTPDAALSALADQGKLSSDPAILSAQVRRMLADPRSEALVDNFVGQWLLTRALDDVNPDSTVYGSFDADLRAAMRGETHRFFRVFLDEDLSALDLLSADFTYVNDRLARHYGLPAVGSTDLKRVQLTPASHRGGILTQASLLTVTSFPKRTSPVKRGKLALDALLCNAPPPPPANIPAFVEMVDPHATLRQRFEAHRKNATCAYCHARMDPIGFGLENFDGIGAWRTLDANATIDATGTLPDGRSFDGPAQLGRILAADPGTPGCIASHLFTYALGRGPAGDDQCHVSAATKTFGTASYRLPALIDALVASPAFKTRRPEGN